MPPRKLSNSNSNINTKPTSTSSKAKSKSTQKNGSGLTSLIIDEQIHMENLEEVEEGDVVDIRTSSEEDKKTMEPVFEMVVLGSGGGPLETDCSGYLLKAYDQPWEDGILGLEGGSGLGALSNLLGSRPANEMFPSLEFPASYDTPVLKAAYVFSFLTCYLITHAHLDHTLSLILLTGSIPPRPSKILQPPIPLPTSSPDLPPKSTEISPNTASTASLPSRPPIYGTRETLERLAGAYGGGLWPELGSWADGVDHGEEALTGVASRKRRKVNTNGPVGIKKEDLAKGSGVVFSPIPPSKEHRELHPTLPISTLTFPVSHGCTTHGLYTSSAIFIRYDPRSSSNSNINGTEPDPKHQHREFLFFGDVESGYRKFGEEGVNAEEGKQAEEFNKGIWEEAAKSWNEGRLAAIFIECSYDTSRPANLMFGHISPPALIHELKHLASLVQLPPASTSDESPRKPLEGLRICVTHIKEALAPHPSGKTSREIIMSELRDLEGREGLGVVFRDVRRGDRILI